MHNSEQIRHFGSTYKLCTVSLVATPSIFFSRYYIWHSDDSCHSQQTPRTSWIKCSKHKVPLKCVPRSQINDLSSLVQVMAWCRMGDQQVTSRTPAATRMTQRDIHTKSTVFTRILHAVVCSVLLAMETCRFAHDLQGYFTSSVAPFY